MKMMTMVTIEAVLPDGRVLDQYTFYPDQMSYDEASRRLRAGLVLAKGAKFTIQREGRRCSRCGSRLVFVDAARSNQTFEHDSDIACVAAAINRLAEAVEKKQG